MNGYLRGWVVVITMCVATGPVFGQRSGKREATAAEQTAAMWTDPGEIKAKNLFYGPGGERDQPQPPFQFVQETKGGASPKFDVRDGSGRKWRVKVGDEAQPETVATRLLWAVGYFSNENYLLPQATIDQLPKLKRGSDFVVQGNTIKQARFQRYPGDEKKTGVWKWRDNSFKSTREFNGLRVMMALISNWDLRDENNAVYKPDSGAGKAIYEVSDVGASFGMSGKSYTDALSKNNLGAYRKSKFISKKTPEYVSFNFPTHPPIFYVFYPPLFFGHLRMHWIGQHIPRSDAKWIGSLLAQLSHDQIHDAFRAAGYTPEQVDAYTAAVQGRIAELSEL